MVGPPVRWPEINLPRNQFGYAFLDNGRTGYFRVPNLSSREMYEIMRGYHVGDLKGYLEEYYRAQRKEMPANIDDAIAAIPSLNGAGAQVLEEMKRSNTPNLVIDLRGSGGGSTPAIEPFFY